MYKCFVRLLDRELDLGGFWFFQTDFYHGDPTVKLEQTVRVIVATDIASSNVRLQFAAVESVDSRHGLLIK